MARLFNKRVAVTVNDLRFANNPNPDAGSYQLEDGRIGGELKMTFKVKRSLDSKTNKATAQIFNLKEDTRGRITVEKPQFIIEAGYLETFATIFQGTAVELSTTRDATGFTTTIVASDGFKQTRERVNVSLGPGASVGDAIEQVAKSMKLGASKALKRAKAGDFDGAVKGFFNGLTMSGRSRDEMDKLARTHGFDWSIQNEELQILLPDEATTEDAVLLSPDTGLITSPVRVIDEKRPGRLIVRAQSLLQPGITPGRIVELDSVEIKGQFKTQDVEHTGDTASSTFFSDWEGVEF